MAEYLFLVVLGAARVEEEPEEMGESLSSELLAGLADAMPPSIIRGAVYFEVDKLG